MKRIISLIVSIVFVFSAFSTLGFISSNAEGEGGATPVVEYQVLEVLCRLSPGEGIDCSPYYERNQYAHCSSSEEFPCGVVQRELQEA